MKTSSWVGVGLVAGATLLCSCGLLTSEEPDPGPTPPEAGDEPSSASRTSADELRRQVLRFADRFTVAVVATSSDIAHAIHDREIRELALLWKMRVIPTLQHAVLVPDRRAAFVDAWALTFQMRSYFATGHGRDVFRDQQGRVNALCDELLEQIVQIGERFLTDEELAAARKDIESFAINNPVSGRFAAQLVTASEEAQRGRGFSLSSILAIPISGLVEGADAIGRMASVAGVLAEIIQDLPERSRWQSEMLLLELDTMNSVTTALDRVEQATSSLQSLSDTVEALPRAVGKEIEAAGIVTEESQRNLIATAREVRAAVESMERAVGKSETVSKFLEATAEDLTGAAVAWNETAASVDIVLKTIDEMGKPDSERPAKTGAEPGKPTEGRAAAPATDTDDDFRISEYTVAAEKIQAAVAEARGLLAELESRTGYPVLVSLSKASKDSVDHASERATALLNLITLRLITVIGVLVVALLAYRLIANMLPRRRPTAV